MPRPDLSPRALALSDKLLNKLDAQTPRTTDDLLLWWERHGVLRVELVRMLRQLVEDGQAIKTPEGFLLAPAGGAEKPEPRAEVRPAPRIETRPEPRVETPVRSPVAPRAEAKPEPRPAAKAETQAEPPRTPKAEPKPEPKAEAKSEPKVEVKPAKSEPKVEVKPAKAEPKAESEPKISTKPGKGETPPPASVEPASKAKAPKSQAAPKSVAPVSEAAPASGEPRTLVARVMEELRRQPQTCATLLTRLKDANPNTVRGALARLKSAGHVRLDDEGVYYPGLASGLRGGAAAHRPGAWRRPRRGSAPRS